MILERFYNEKLAQASFLLGCGASGEAIVVDANRDVDAYLDAATTKGLRIVGVTETHIHADYVSGSRELAERAGATLFLSGAGGPDWLYGFSDEPNVVVIRAGDVLRVGGVRLDVLETPGHTPEHLTFVITDERASDQPLGALTGDFVFVGDVGRPDLLERAAGVSGTMEIGARQLFRSLQEFKRRLPDSLIVWPGHGAGTACGKSLGGVPMSTLGYERATNWALSIDDEAEFVQHVLSGQPEPPRYFAQMKRINRKGPPLLGGFRTPPRLGGRRILDLLATEATILDVRSAGDAATGSVPGTLNIPLDRSFANWAGWLVPYDRPIYVLASGEEDAEEAVRDLHTIGLDDVRGRFGSDALRAYEAAQGPLAIVDQMSAPELAERHRCGDVCVIDIRGSGEYVEGHIPGVPNIPLGYLEERLAEVPRDRPVVVQCQGGTRSPIGVSLLRKLGYTNAINLTGGFIDYVDAGLPVEAVTA